MKFKSKIYLDYDDIKSMNQNLVHDVSKFKPDVIVGITRGGLLPALHLSHHLDRPLQTITWQTRYINKCEHDKQLQEKIDAGTRVVLVDSYHALHSSYQLDRPLQTRDVNKCEHDKKLQNLIDTGSRVVFVDDINDTGRTFSEISKAYHGARSNVMFISLVQKLETTHPATAALTLSDDRWIVFPWEKD